MKLINYFLQRFSIWRYGVFYYYRDCVVNSALDELVHFQLAQFFGKHFTMKGISKPVVLNVDYGGIVQDPWGNTRIGFTVTGKVNRSDFGISFGLLSETGGVMLSDEVKISANVQYVKVAELEPA